MDKNAGVIEDGLQKIINNNCPIIDTHCHIFNKDFVPDGFLGIRVPFTDKYLSDIAHFLDKLNPFTDADPLSYLSYFVDFFNNRSMEAVLLKLFTYYPDDTIFCPLMMDMQYGVKGKLKKDVFTQLDEMNQLKNKYKNRILPFVAIDPRNPSAEELFDKAFSTGYNFTGVKIYPSLGYLPTHPVLMKIFAKCEQHSIPVITHCGRGDVRYNKGFTIKNIESEGSTPVTKTFFSISAVTQYFNAPSKWEPVLEKYKKLKLDFAHFGGDDEWIKFGRLQENSWVTKIIELMQKYPGVYADCSYNIYNRKVTEYLRECMKRNPLILDRVLYGSDYYMSVMKGHFRGMKTDFMTDIGSVYFDRMARTNPVRFLFGTV